MPSRPLGSGRRRLRGSFSVVEVMSRSRFVVRGGGARCSGSVAGSVAGAVGPRENDRGPLRGSCPRSSTLTARFRSVRPHGRPLPRYGGGERDQPPRAHAVLAVGTEFCHVG